MPPSKILTGPASSGRLVCAPGPLAVAHLDIVFAAEMVGNGSSALPARRTHLPGNEAKPSTDFLATPFDHAQGFFFVVLPKDSPEHDDRPSGFGGKNPEITLSQVRDAAKSPGSTSRPPSASALPLLVGRLWRIRLPQLAQHCHQQRPDHRQEPITLLLARRRPG
jgi:hypothetical protein